MRELVIASDDPNTLECGRERERERERVIARRIRILSNVGALWEMIRIHGREREIAREICVAREIRMRSNA